MKECPQTYTKLALKPSSQHVIQLLNYIEQHNGILVHSSGHGKEEGEELKGTLIYRFRLTTGIMVAINKDLPSVYIKQNLETGHEIFTLIPEAKSFLFKTYSLSKRGESSKGYNTHLDKFDWLNPSIENPTLCLQKVEISIAKRIVNCLIGLKNEEADCSKSNAKNSSVDKKSLSLEEFANKLERQSEIGRKGERIAYQFEYIRLLELGLMPTDAANVIQHVALDDVAKGYDIESHYNGESRYIEVKTTIAKAESDFFFSLNEYEILKQKGDEAFIYRVVLAEKDEDSQVVEIQNPFGARDQSEFHSVAFKANLSDFT